MLVPAEFVSCPRSTRREQGIAAPQRVEYQNQCRLCYVRGPAGIIVALAEERS